MCEYTAHFLHQQQKMQLQRGVIKTCLLLIEQRTVQLSYITLTCVIAIIFIISQCVGGSKKPPERYYSYHNVITIISPCPETFKVVVLTPLHSC